jgi:hypothetical protein
MASSRSLGVIDGQAADYHDTPNSPSYLASTSLLKKLAIYGAGEAIYDAGPGHTPGDPRAIDGQATAIDAIDGQVVGDGGCHNPSCTSPQFQIALRRRDPLRPTGAVGVSPSTTERT